MPGEAGTRLWGGRRELGTCQCRVCCQTSGGVAASGWANDCAMSNLHAPETDCMAPVTAGTATIAIESAATVLATAGPELDCHLVWTGCTQKW